MKKIFNISLAVIYTLVNLYFVYSIININVLPNEIVIIISSLTILTNIISCYFNLKSEKNNIILKIFIILCIVVLGTGNYFINHYYNETANFFEIVNQNNKYNTSVYQVYVSTESGINDINDLTNENVGYALIDEAVIELVEIEINANVEVLFERYDSTYEMIMDLDSGIKAIVLKNTQYELLDENESDLLENLVLLKEYEIVLENVQITSEKNLTNDPFIVYITGFDAYGNISLTGRSDVNMLAIINPNTKDISLVSIPRDYYVEFPGLSGLRDKLTHSGVYGLDVSISTIENLLDIEIDHYIKVNFSTLVNIIDIIGPLEVESAYAFCSWGTCFNKGVNVLDGALALTFSRERKTLPNGDIDRALNQQRVINAIIKKSASPDILMNYTNILASNSQYFATSLTSNDITSLVKMQLSDFSNWTTSNYVINGYGSYEYTYSYPHQKLSVLLHDTDSINEAKDIINNTLNK